MTADVRYLRETGSSLSSSKINAIRPRTNRPITGTDSESQSRCPGLFQLRNGELELDQGLIVKDVGYELV